MRNYLLSRLCFAKCQKNSTSLESISDTSRDRSMVLHQFLEWPVIAIRSVLTSCAFSYIRGENVRVYSGEVSTYHCFMSILTGKGAPLSGMGMMLKGLGVDIPALEKQFTSQMSALVQYAKEINEKLSDIQTRLSKVEEKQSNVGSNTNSNRSSD